MQEVDRKPAGRLVTGVMALPLVAMVLGAVLMPPAIAYSLIRRGASEGYPSWVALGLVAAALWLLGLWLTARSLSTYSATARPSTGRRRQDRPLDSRRK